MTGALAAGRSKPNPYFSRLIQNWFWEPIKSLGSDIQNDLKHSNVDLPRAQVELRISDSRTDFVADALGARFESQCLDYAACPAINDRVGAIKFVDGFQLDQT